MSKSRTTQMPEPALAVFCIFESAYSCCSFVFSLLLIVFLLSTPEDIPATSEPTEIVCYELFYNQFLSEKLQNHSTFFPECLISSSANPVSNSFSVLHLLLFDHRLQTASPSIYKCTAMKRVREEHFSIRNIIQKFFDSCITGLVVFFIP